MKEVFLDRFFPPSRILQLRDEIINFQQLSGMPLNKEWLRFNRKWLKFPNHEVLDNILLQIFYRALNQLKKIVVDNAVGGSIIKQTVGVASRLLDQVTKQSRAW